MKKVLALISLIAVVLAFPLLARAQTDVTVSAHVPSKVSATLSTLVTNLSELPADGTSMVIITTTLVDKDGNVLPNLDATLSSNRGNVDIIGAYDGNNLTESTTGKSNSSGIIRYAARSYAAGQATFTLFADSEITLAEKPTVTFTPLPAISNIVVTVPLPKILPGKGKITLLEPKSPTPTTDKSDVANRKLVNTQINLQIPFWIFLIAILIILLNPTLIILVIYLIRRVKHGFLANAEYKNKEQDLLNKVFLLEQQMATNQQFAYQNDKTLSKQIEETKTDLEETIESKVDEAVEKATELGVETDENSPG